MANLDLGNLVKGTNTNDRQTFCFPHGDLPTGFSSTKKITTEAAWHSNSNPSGSTTNMLLLYQHPVQYYLPSHKKSNDDEEGG